MGYRVEYSLGSSKIRKKEKRSGVVALSAGCLLLFALLVNAFWPQGAHTLRELLLPGNAAVTAAALEGLAEDLGSGIEIPEALEAFCRKVMNESAMDPG